MESKYKEIARTKFEEEENRRLLEKYKNDFAESLKGIGDEIITELETPVKISKFKRLMLRIKYILGK